MLETKMLHPGCLLDIKCLHPPAPEHEKASHGEVLFREHRGQVPPDRQEDLHRQGVQVSQGQGGQGVQEKVAAAWKFRERRSIRLSPRCLSKNFQQVPG